MKKLEECLQEELDVIKEKNLERKIRGLRFITPVKAIDETGAKYLVFSSNNYLGLTHAPEVIRATKDALEYGTGSTGSRLTKGSHFESLALEKALAKFNHTEAALTFNTGYMTNLGLLYGLVKANDVIFSDSLNHASIIDGCRISKCEVKVYSHSNMEDLEKLLREDKTLGHRYIVTDGVFSMDGDIANLPELVRLKEKYNATLIVDDAHGVGVIGDNGGGTADYYKLYGKIDLQVGTLSKALASEGGYVAGKKIYIDYLINKSRPFIFSTALSPASHSAALAALNLLITKKDLYLNKLKENALYMRSLLEKGKVKVIPGETPIIPIMVGEAKRATQFANKLLEQNILVSAIRPPTVPQGECRLRLTVTAAHSKKDVEKASIAIIETWDELCRGK